MQEHVRVEALSWVDTPYLHMARVKGSGCDCATFLIGVYEAVGALPRLRVDYYPPDWNLHRSEELYLNQLLKYAGVVTGAREVGDVLMFKMGRTVSHGAIWIGQEQVVHSWRRSGGVTVDRMDNPYWQAHYSATYRLKEST
jgi:cell wall-associated NlpC family hydrolase